MKDPNIYYQSNYLAKTVKKKYREMASLYVPANTLGGMAHLHGESGEEQANSQEHRQFLHQGPFLKKFPAKRYNQLFQVSKFYVAPIQPFHPFDSKAPLAIQQNLTLVSYWTLLLQTKIPENVCSYFCRTGWAADMVPQEDGMELETGDTFMKLKETILTTQRMQQWVKTPAQNEASGDTDSQMESKVASAIRQPYPDVERHIKAWNLTQRK